MSFGARPGFGFGGGGGGPRFGLGFRPRAPPPQAAPPPQQMPAEIPTGPPVTVFVGNITERAQDAMVRHLLTTCGPVVSWKRVQGATGRLQAFGFCEYANPDAAARAIRTLHDMMIADKKLVVKVDAKTKPVLDEYKRQRRKKMTGKSPTQEELEGSDEGIMDPQMRHEDSMTRDRIRAILMDHSAEMESYVPHDVKRMERRYREGDGFQTGPKESLDDVDMEDGKREMIHSEIAKFRETMKQREAEKQRELEKEKKKDRDKDSKTSGDAKDAADANERGKSVERVAEKSGGGGDDDITVIEERAGSRKRSRSRSRKTGSSRRSRSRSRSPSDSRRRRERDRSSSPRESRSRGSRHRSRSRSRERRPPPRDVDYDRDRGGRGRDRERERDRDRDGKTSWKEREKEEEEREKRKEEKRTAEKEASYQERIRKWEAREEKKAKEYTKQKSKETKKTDEQDKEAKKLKEFLEDYDDGRDDDKYYKGRELDRRLAEREREAAKDGEDRKKEEAELEELKAQIAKEGFDDPAAELQRRIAVEEKMAQMRAAQQAAMGAVPPGAAVPGQNGAPHNVVIMGQMPPVHQVNEDNDDEDDDRGHFEDDAVVPTASHDSPIGVEDERDIPQPVAPPPVLPTYVPDIAPMPIPEPVSPPPSAVPAPQVSLGPQLKITGRKKLEMRDVFNQGEDDGSTPSKRKRLPPSSHHSSSKKLHAAGEGAGGGNSEDKRRHIKSLIEKIPTDKAALFEYKVDWDMVDAQLMEKRIRPWVNKKIQEYIGEPEPTLTEFICSKVLAGSSPNSVLEDVQMVLDEEAEVFVVKMWRLLIYEIENKRMKATAAAVMSGGGGS